MDASFSNNVLWLNGAWAAAWFGITTWLIATSTTAEYMDIAMFSLFHLFSMIAVFLHQKSKSRSWIWIGAFSIPILIDVSILVRLIHVTSVTCSVCRETLLGLQVTAIGLSVTAIFSYIYNEDTTENKKTKMTKSSTFRNVILGINAVWGVGWFILSVWITCRSTAENMDMSTFSLFHLFSIFAIYTYNQGQEKHNRAWFLAFIIPLLIDVSVIVRLCVKTISTNDFWPALVAFQAVAILLSGLGVVFYIVINRKKLTVLSNQSDYAPKTDYQSVFFNGRKL
jgi:hypothetical protein